jgi:hypothetical protein
MLQVSESELGQGDNIRGIGLIHLGQSFLGRLDHGLIRIDPNDPVPHPDKGRAEKKAEFTQTDDSDFHDDHLKYKRLTTKDILAQRRRDAEKNFFEELFEFLTSSHALRC